MGAHQAGCASGDWPRADAVSELKALHGSHVHVAAGQEADRFTRSTEHVCVSQAFVGCRCAAVRLPPGTIGCGALCGLSGVAMACDAPTLLAREAHAPREPSPLAVPRWNGESACVLSTAGERLADELWQLQRHLTRFSVSNQAPARGAPHA